MRKVFTVFLVLLASLLPGRSVAGAAPETPREWSEAVQKRYADTKSMHLFFEQRVTHAESSISEERRGEIYFQRPLLVRWSVEAPHEELLVVTDKLVWQYFPDEALVYKYPLESIDDRNAFLRVLSGLSSLEESFEITILPEERKLVRLKLEPYEPSASLLEAGVWLEAESAIIKRLSITDYFGNVSDLDIKELRLNPELPAGVFSFIPPEGVEMEDHAK
jgi:outer membrane lipoprotein carrier protein